MLTNTFRAIPFPKVMLLLALTIALALALPGSPRSGVAQADEPGPGGGQAPDAPTAVGPDVVSSGSHGNPDSVLLITFDGNGRWAPNSLNLHTNLSGLGYTVTHLYNPAPGVIASTLAAGTFEQVWLFDINNFNRLPQPMPPLLQRGTPLIPRATSSLMPGATAAGTRPPLSFPLPPTMLTPSACAVPACG